MRKPPPPPPGPDPYQRDLFAQNDMYFDGKTYEHERDSGRLSKQMKRIFAVMLDGQWRTLDQIAQLTGDPTASISARLRDLRKPRFGRYTMSKRHVGPPEDGLYEYRVLVNDKIQTG